jgi:hypothetical protein
MDYKLQRFVIKKEKSNYFIGVDHRKKKFRIIKNEYSSKFKVGNDRYIYYLIVKKSFFSVTINPISDEVYLKSQETGASYINNMDNFPFLSGIEIAQVGE